MEARKPLAGSAQALGARPLPLFEVTSGATHLHGDTVSAAEHFAEHRAILCNGAIQRDFLALLFDVLARAEFRSDRVEGLGHREIEKPALAGRAISLALNRRTLLDWIATVARCGRLGSVEGRVVQTALRPDDRLRWHDDLEDTGTQRRLGITIGLSNQAYDGGLFELREKDMHTALFHHRHVEPGQALIFDVAPDVEHRLCPITAGGPRRVYTGWFIEDAT